MATIKIALDIQEADGLTDQQIREAFLAEHPKPTDSPLSELTDTEWLELRVKEWMNVQINAGRRKLAIAAATAAITDADFCP